MTVIQFSRPAIAAMIVTFGFCVATSDAANRAARTSQRAGIMTQLPDKASGVATLAPPTSWSKRILPSEIRMITPLLPEPQTEQVWKQGKPNWLNPQPEPPAPRLKSTGNWLNPQPEPPAPWLRPTGNWLNPQPEPPDPTMKSTAK
jgi:hypothetical protein